MTPARDLVNKVKEVYPDTMELVTADCLELRWAKRTFWYLVVEDDTTVVLRRSIPNGGGETEPEAFFPGLDDGNKFALALRVLMVLHKFSLDC